MRVYQALRSSVVWSLSAAARSRHSGAVVPVSYSPCTRLPSVPGVSTMWRRGSMLRPHPSSGAACFRHSPSSTGRVLLELRAGAGVGGIMTKFTQTIEASKTKSWIVLLLSICNETLAVTLIKKAQETKSARLMAVAIGLYIVTLFGFALTLTQIDVSIAYAVWGALGSCIVTCAGILLFHESYTLKKLACIFFIVVGVAGLNLLDET